jgi:hypothetical protein
VVPCIAPEILLLYYQELRYRLKRPERFAHWSPPPASPTTADAPPRPIPGRRPSASARPPRRPCPRRPFPPRRRRGRARRSSASARARRSRRRRPRPRPNRSSTSRRRRAPLRPPHRLGRPSSRCSIPSRASRRLRRRLLPPVRRRRRPRSPPSRPLPRPPSRCRPRRRCPRSRAAAAGLAVPDRQGAPDARPDAGRDCAGRAGRAGRAAGSRPVGSRARRRARDGAPWRGGSPRRGQAHRVPVGRRGRAPSLAGVRRPGHPLAERPGLRARAFLDAAPRGLRRPRGAHDADQPRADRHRPTARGPAVFLFRHVHASRLGRRAAGRQDGFADRGSHPGHVARRPAGARSGRGWGDAASSATPGPAPSTAPAAAEAPSVGVAPPVQGEEPAPRRTTKERCRPPSWPARWRPG